MNPELLKELGWTEDQLKAFTDRMQEQLAERQLTEQQQREKGLSQKSFEEMLRSLDLNTSGRTRAGSFERDREQQDTTIRKSAPPSRYREWQRMYERSLNNAASSAGK